MFDELKEFKAQAEERSGRRLTWGDFFAILMGLHELRSTGIEPQIPIAHMGQDDSDDKPLSQEELEELGVTTFSFIQEQDLERIADRVAQKVLEVLKGLNPARQEMTSTMEVDNADPEPEI